jgi:RNA 3'-terminal phosphate cyclase (ATP)
VCGGRLLGAHLGSQELVFEPGEVKGGDYLLDVAEETRSAGSVTLLLQALLPALSFAGAASRLSVRGGTHVAWSPPFHHLAEVFLPVVREMGLRAEARLVRWGWYPQGGGEVEAEVRPVGSPRGEAAGRLAPLDWEGPFRPEQIECLSATSRLPVHVAERQRERLLYRLSERGLKASCEVVDAPAASPGSFVFVKARHDRRLAGFSALGERGKPAERVADEAVGALFDFLEGVAAAEEHLADQLVLYLALADGVSRLTVQRLSGHLMTNIWVVERFLGKVFEIEGEPGGPGWLSARGVAWGRS